MLDRDLRSSSIVFVHGLRGDRLTIWTSESKGQNPVFWPRDLLPAIVQNARVLTFGYDADVVGVFGSAIQARLQEHAQGLALDLLNEWEPDRPIIFVAHSMGGLLVERALTMCLFERGPEYQAITRATHDICFLGTPHAGADLAKFAGGLGKLANIFVPTSSALLNVLVPGSQVLASVSQSFHTMRKCHVPGMKLHCFHEDSPYSKLGMIVDFQSALLPGEPSSPCPATMLTSRSHRTRIIIVSNELPASFADGLKLAALVQAATAPIQMMMAVVMMKVVVMMATVVMAILLARLI